MVSRKKVAENPIGPTLEEVQELLKGTALKLGFNYEPKVLECKEENEIAEIQTILKKL